MRIKCSFYLILSFICTKLIAVEFKIISLENFDKLEEIRFQDESSSQTLNIKKYYPNRSYPVPKGNLIHFYGINPDTKASSKRPLLRLSFKDHTDDVIIFLRQNKEDPSKIDTEFLKNDDTSFPKSSALILNFSNHEVVAKIGAEFIKLQSNSKILVSLPVNEKGTFSGEVLFANKQKNNGINFFFISNWRITEGHKMLCIIEASEQLNSNSLKEIYLQN